MGGCFQRVDKLSHFSATFPAPCNLTHISSAQSKFRFMKNMSLAYFKNDFNIQNLNTVGQTAQARPTLRNRYLGLHEKEKSEI